jgi:hypothetical protein
MIQTLRFTDNLYPWLEQVAGVSRLLVTPLEELPDRLFFEDAGGCVLRSFLAHGPIISTPKNHGRWVVLSLRWKDTPSAQLCVCRRLDAASGERDLFYEIDFDFAPWDPTRLDWAAEHTYEVLCNKLRRQTTDQVVLQKRLAESGVVFA